MSIDFDLSQFDEYREDNRREVKKANGGLPVSLWDTYSAFANCYGGVIILGVKEEKDGSWKTTGLQNASKLRKDFWDTINNSKKVNINLLSCFLQAFFGHNCKIILDIIAKHFWTLLQVQIGQSCKASTGSYPASRIAIADHI